MYLKKVSFEDLKKKQYEGVILIKCCNCGLTKEIRKLKDIYRCWCKDCKKVLAADYELTENAIKISWQEFEYYEQLIKMKKKYKIKKSP